MIYAFLTKTLLGAPRWLWLVIAFVLLLVAAAIWWTRSEEADDKANQEIGATVQREDDLRETLERTETGNEAREAIEQSGPAGDQRRYDQCVRSARTPANCQRFLPQ